MSHVYLYTIAHITRLQLNLVMILTLGVNWYFLHFGQRMVFCWKHIGSEGYTFHSTGSHHILLCCCAVVLIDNLAITSQMQTWQHQQSSGISTLECDQQQVAMIS